MAKTEEKDVKKLLLRIPKDTHKRVQKRAKDNERSLNGQIVYELNRIAMADTR